MSVSAAQKEETDYKRIHWYHAVNNKEYLEYVLDQINGVVYGNGSKVTTEGVDASRGKREKGGEVLYIGIEVDVRLGACLSKAVLHHDPFPEGTRDGFVSADSLKDDVTGKPRRHSHSRHGRGGSVPGPGDAEGPDVVALVDFFKIIVSCRWFQRRWEELQCEGQHRAETPFHLVIKFDFKDPRAAVELQNALASPASNSSPYHSFFFLCQTLITQAPQRNGRGRRELSLWYNADVVPAGPTVVAGAVSLHDRHVRSLRYIDVPECEIMDHIVALVTQLNSAIQKGWTISLGFWLPAGFTAYTCEDIGRLHLYTMMLWDTVQLVRARTCSIVCITFALAIEPLFEQANDDTRFAVREMLFSTNGVVFSAEETRGDSSHCFLTFWRLHKNSSGASVHVPKAQEWFPYSSIDVD